MKGEKHSVTTPSPIGSAIPSPVGWHNIHRCNIYRTLVRDYRSCSGASKKCRSNVGSCRLIGLCFLLICLSLITGGRASIRIPGGTSRLEISKSFLMFWRDGASGQ